MDDNETPVSWKGIDAGARLVTADGRVAYRHRGVLTSQRQLDDYVATYLGVTV